MAQQIEKELEVKMVPCRFLRKAWFIILRDVLENPDGYENYYSHAKRQGFRKAVLESVKTYAERNIRFADDIEQNWFENEREFEGEMITVSHKLVYRIEKNIGLICTAIKSAGDIGDPIKSQKTKKVRANIAVQQYIHKSLSNFVENGKDLYFPDSSFYSSFRVARQVLKFAKTIVEKKLSYKNQIKENQSYNTDLLVLRFLEYELEKEFQNKIGLKRSRADSVKNMIKENRSFWKPDFDHSFTKQNSFWVQYMRTDGKKSDPGYGIAVSAVVFRKTFNGYLQCDMYNKHYFTDTDFDLAHYSGFATIEDSEWLHLDLLKVIVGEKRPVKANATMRIGKNPKRSICIGMFRYSSPKFNNKFLSKSAIWHKQNFSDLPMLENNEIDVDTLRKVYVTDLKAKDDESRIRKIPLEIRSYLYHRHQNRLTMPDIAITQIYGDTNSSLQEWLKEKHPRDQQMDCSCGRYAVIYHTQDQDIVESSSDQEIMDATRLDTIEIEFDDIGNYYRAKFQHRVDGTIVQYSGEPRRYENTIELALSNNAFNGHVIEQNIVLITFKVTEKNEKFFKKEIESVPYFVGIISGLSDNGNRPLAIKAIIVKRHKLQINVDDNLYPDNIKAKYVKQIKKFFITNRGHLSLSI